MKLIFITGYYFPMSLDESISCGALRFNFTMARVLSKLGHDIHVICPAQGGNGSFQKIDGVRVHRYVKECARIFYSDFHISFRRNRLLKKLLPADGIHSTTPLSLEIDAFSNLPYIYTNCGFSDINNYGNSLKEMITACGIIMLRDPLKRRSWTKATKVNTTSAGEFEYLKKAGLSDHKIVTVPPGLELDRYFPKTVRELRKKLGLENAKVVLSVGRFTPAKGFHLLLKAFRSILQQHPKAYLLLIGVDLTHRRDYKDGLRKIIKEEGIGNRVQIIKNVPEKVLPSYYNVADVFVSFSTGYDPLPTTIFEASACGLPVISTDWNTRYEQVEDNVTGYMTPEGDMTTLCHIINRLLDQPALRKRIGLAGRKKMVREHDPINQANKLVDLFSNRVSH